MRYVSTRGSSESLSLSEAMLQGLASDGGLFVPESWPENDWSSWPTDLSYAACCQRVLSPFFLGDELESSLSDICAETFTFPVPVQHMNAQTDLMELFHGPTLSFKDFGARFLANCVSRLSSDKPMTILTATSGDTGSAVAAAFYRKSPVRVMVLFPEGHITARQEKQITCWGENVLAVAVDGVFDDCQRLLKSVFADDWWHEHTRINTSNSINIGRLLPQVTYFAYHSWRYFCETGERVRFVVPSGNLGNVTAAFWAQAIGFPISNIVLSTNANKVVTDFLETGIFEPRKSEATLASAMDVGAPSNMERLRFLFPDFSALREQVSAVLVDDAQIEQTVQTVHREYGIVICPHTATAYAARLQLDDRLWCVVATADPCKFEDVLEPLLNIKVPPTAALQELLDRPSHVRYALPEMQALRDQYAAYFLEASV